MVSILHKILFLFATLSTVSCIHDKYIDVESYHGYSVISIEPETIEEMNILAKLREHPQLDFWTEIGLNRPVNIMLTPTMRKSKMFEGLKSKVIIENVQELIENEKLEKSLVKSRISGEAKITWDDYYNYNEISDWMNEIAANCDYAETEVIGQSFEGQDLTVMKLCKGGCGSKPAVWLDGGIHAREWISPAVTTYALNQLASNPENMYDKLLDNLDWYILPSANPDGYNFTIEHARLWRKTRSDSGSIFGCRGTDANRNFGFQWNTGGSSNDKCFDTYHGPSAFSEPETAAVRDFILSLNGTVKYFNDQHSFSQLILLPWGFTSDPPENSFELLKAAEIGNDALKAVHGSDYTVGCTPCLLYVASGSSEDWALGEAGIPYSYSVELRDTGRYGFLLPRDQILATSEEIWAFHQAVANYIIDNSQ